MRFVAVLFLLMATGCAKKSSPAAYGYGGMDEMAEAEEMRVASRGPRRKTKMARPASAPSPMPEAAMDMDDEVPPDEPEDAGRMVHYDGLARIRTPRAASLLDDVEATVLEAKGYVESRGSEYITTKVPVDAFEAVWEKVLGLGRVEHKRLSASDVTDAFRDTSLRLDATKATRDRLQVLLAEASTDLERMQLLKQIHALTDQIDAMEQQVAVLQSLAALSSLTVQATGMRNDMRQALPQGMQWIDLLSPFERRQAQSWKKVNLPDPEGFVRLEKQHWLAESADGAVIQGGRVLNDPQGDATFWIEAIHTRIGEEFQDGTRSEQGGWQLVRLVEQGNDTPYAWHLAVRVSGKHLEVATAFFPSAESEERHRAAFLAALGGGGAS